MEVPIDVIEVAEQQVLGIRRKTDLSRISSDIGAMYHELFAYLGRRGIQPMGPPYSEYFDVGVSEIDMECGVPVPPGSVGEGNIEARVVPGGLVLRAVHKGPYDRLVDTYTKIDAWMREHGYVYSGCAREVYHSDPIGEPDQSKWVTEILWPVKKE